ncbi:hypothetical protein Poli38472_012925 [Pythium oligandrum]|uniref:Uncharacterized protein n=1 Tax=Pythium oligandrum TaxID=41045 RepID=A0A8K1FN51_PYTOL|nr:hypothetical protein Poli38472_012925 [Pythium oligandrum]|eukprot:TMW64303.1 hypothetical protein Poli38472_012925 [Pythium oligandrum]
MAEVFLRNRRVDERRARHGFVPLSSGEVEYLKRQDETAFRKQRLLQVREHERRVAQEVTRRYRENLRRLQGQRLRLTQREHHSQREILLTELHRKYQYSLQNVGAAQKNAREKLVELVNQAHLEKDKWAFNAQAEKLRYVDATDMVKEEETQRLARRREIERNLLRLKEMSNKQRSQAASRARRELEWELKMEQEREEAALLRRNQAEMEVFSFPRTNSKDVTSYHFTRTHCVAAPGSTHEKSDKPRTEVKVIRHNPLRQEANAIDAAATYRQEMDEKSEANRTKREEETRIAASRGNDAVQRVESDRKGAEAMRHLAAMDQEERVRRAGNVPVHEDNEDPITRAELAEDEFAALFGIHDDELNNSWGRSVEEDATSAVERVHATRRVGLDDSIDSEADSFIRIPSQGRDGGPVHPHDVASAGDPVEGDDDLSIQQKFDRMKALLEKVGTSDRRATSKDGDGDYQREVQPRDVYEGHEESHSLRSVDDMSVVSETVNAEEEPQTLKKPGGEALFVGFGEEEEEKENDQEEGSLADAFRRRHPEFQRRAQRNQELIEQRRQQQEDQQEPARPAAERQEEQTPERKQSARSRVSLPDGSSFSPMPRSNLLDRLASGERAKMSAQEMRERTRRLYQQLPEVVERKRQEEVLAKRRQRLHELREREKERRQQQRQRKSQSQGRPSLG